MKNQDTWVFAHHYFGNIWFKMGIILLPVSMIVMFLTIGKSKDTISTVGQVLCVIEILSVIVSIIPTEIALRKTFDKAGNRR